jgi:hypothetical protein
LGTKKTTILLHEDERDWIERYSEDRKLPMAETIRIAIRNLREVDGRETYAQLLQETKGLWKKGNGLNYQRKIRSEWGA